MANKILCYILVGQFVEDSENVDPEVVEPLAALVKDVDLSRQAAICCLATLNSDCPRSYE